MDPGAQMYLTTRSWEFIHFYRYSVPDGVMAAQMTLAHWIEVRIFVGQPLKYPSHVEGVMGELPMMAIDLF